MEFALRMNEIFVTMRSDYDNFVNISVMQLSSTVASVERDLKQCSQAMTTIPAHFNELQRGQRHES